MKNENVKKSLNTPQALTNREINLEIVGAPPIEDKAGVIAKLAKGEEQTVAEIR